MRNPFRKKAITRGRGKSPAERLKEEKSRADLILARHWSKYLESHPQFAVEVARAKFSVPEPTAYEDGEADGLVTEIEKLKSIRELVSSFNEGEGSGGSLVGELIKAVAPSLGEGLKGILAAQTGGQPGYQPAAHQVQAAPQQAQISQQSEMLDRIDELMGMTAEQVAQQIWVGSTKAQSLEAMLFNLVSGYEFDDLMNALPQLTSLPGWQFLAPVVRRLMRPAERARLAAVYDELRRLEQEGDQGENQANEGKSDEMASGFTLNAGDA